MLPWIHWRGSVAATIPTRAPDGSWAGEREWRSLYHPPNSHDLQQRPLDIAVETGHLALAMELLNHEAVLRFLPVRLAPFRDLHGLTEDGTRTHLQTGRPFCGTQRVRVSS